MRPAAGLLVVACLVAMAGCGGSSDQSDPIKQDATDRVVTICGTVTFQQLSRVYRTTSSHRIAHHVAAQVEALVELDHRGEIDAGNVVEPPSRSERTRLIDTLTRDCTAAQHATSIELRSARK